MRMFRRSLILLLAMSPAMFIVANGYASPTGLSSSSESHMRSSLQQVQVTTAGYTSSGTITAMTINGDDATLLPNGSWSTGGTPVTISVTVNSDHSLSSMTLNGVAATLQSDGSWKTSKVSCRAMWGD